ncbi:MAG TPA: tRNA (adenosine(37)-N6)-threonylcarbamoyltransferase complex ATPase subunit type 1 TsaE [Candidatus Cloacimonas sp.]|jgi:tRNA threonylcarbamoyladenosine biosynthesis protein TsaE|nr:tRNA (adenosine(37)-N6)-threonylcarbamoyltransferase complex ATPase subunit type 1 TsaE [Candidatus Cloacimonas sp.]
MQTQEINLNSKEDTRELARKIAKQLVKGSVLALYGQLGTGKTFFTQKLCKFLGVSEVVSSPSYVLMNEYRGKIPIFHLDLYRLTSWEEVLELGLEELFESGITIIEWPEVAEKLLPPNTLKIKFNLQNNIRTAVISYN